MSTTTSTPPTRPTQLYLPVITSSNRSPSSIPQQRTISSSPTIPNNHKSPVSNYKPRLNGSLSIHSSSKQQNNNKSPRSVSTDEDHTSSIPHSTSNLAHRSRSVITTSSNPVVLASTVNEITDADDETNLSSSTNNQLSMTQTITHTTAETSNMISTNNSIYEATQATDDIVAELKQRQMARQYNSVCSSTDRLYPLLGTNGIYCNKIPVEYPLNKLQLHTLNNEQLDILFDSYNIEYNKLSTPNELQLKIRRQQLSHFIGCDYQPVKKLPSCQPQNNDYVMVQIVG